jgi:hypothetical protein
MEVTAFASIEVLRLSSPTTAGCAHGSYGGAFGVIPTLAYSVNSDNIVCTLNPLLHRLGFEWYGVCVYDAREINTISVPRVFSKFQEIQSRDIILLY